MQKLTQKRLKKVLHYNKKTGVFVRKLATNSSGKVGSAIGSDNGSGYLKVSIDNTAYYLHRLAFLYEYGYFPEYGIDHINRDKHNNILANLREVNHSCNLKNSANRIDNTSGIKGVSWCKDKNKWTVRITTEHAYRFLGRFTDFTEAVATRLAAEQAANWSGCDSSSPAYKYMQNYLR